MKPATDLSKYTNTWYKSKIGASLIRRACWYFVNAAFFINPIFAGSSWRRGLLRLFGAKVGRGVVLKQQINIKYPWKLTIGDHSWIGEKVWIDNLEQVTIGSHVCLSQGAMLLTGNHDYTKTTFDLIVKGITLEDGVWIGAQSLVCPGITCQSHAVLSAMSVATKNLEAYTIYQGNPAQAVRTREIGS